MQEYLPQDAVYSWGFSALRRGILMIFISVIFVIFSLIGGFMIAFLGIETVVTRLLLASGIVGTVLMIVGGYVVYTGLEELVKIDPSLKPARTGALLMVIGTLGMMLGSWVPIFLLFGWLGVLAFLGGGALLLYGLWVMGERDITGRVRRGVILVIAGVVLLVILVGILLLAWGLWDIYKGLEIVEEQYRGAGLGVEAV